MRQDVVVLFRAEHERLIVPCSALQAVLGMPLCMALPAGWPVGSPSTRDSGPRLAAFTVLLAVLASSCPCRGRDACHVVASVLTELARDAVAGHLTQLARPR